MVNSDVPEITKEMRSELSQIFNSQFNEVRENINHMITYPNALYAEEVEYHNVFALKHNNIIKYHDGKDMMSVFNFSVKNTIRILRILNIEKFNPLLNGIRVYAGNRVPMHVDFNKGDIGREFPILSVPVSGKDGYVFMSNKKDGSVLVAIPGLSNFILYPTLIEHGAQAGLENYDLLQIQLTSIL